MSSSGAECARPGPAMPRSPPPPPGHGHGHGCGSSPAPCRGLERALEEAASSGVLSLSSRKLKEFPQAASNHDLSDTVEADLSRNRLTDFATDMCHFVALETLNLYHNCIKTIPDSIISLQSLTSLNISRNQICSLPPCLCSLPLRVLNASNNRLDSLPGTIGRLQGLMELDISCNDISALPRQIGKLRALRELNVRRNILCVLPEDLAELPLVKLDFSCNKVSTIPVCYRKMKHLQYLQLENNPLQSPPAQICIKGKVHIFKYLTVEACRSEKLPDPLYLPVMGYLSQPAGSVEDLEQQRKQDSDSGVGSDSGDKRLSATEPSDEDSPSITMTHITEEDGITKTDVVTESPTEALRDRFISRDSSLSSGFVSYIKGRTAGLDEPLRIDEELQWPAQQVVSVKVGCVRESNHNQDSDDRVTTPKQLDRSPGGGPQPLSNPVFGLKQRSVFLGSLRSVESADPQFTMRRKMEQLREELELMEQLRHSIESRLKLILPEDLGPFLMDGVVLCHLANHIHPRSVSGIHVPSPAAPKLGMAKCRRNVENFLEACRKIGVPEDKLSLPHHILEGKGLTKVSVTVQALVDKASSRRDQHWLPC